MRYADIVLPLAQPLYTFAVAEGVTLCEGMAVVVPFGRSKIYTGIVWRLHDRRPDFKTVKTVSRVLYGTPLLDERQRRFWEWVADYYMCTLGEVMRVALPSLMKPSGHGEEEFAADEFRPRREWFYISVILMKNSLFCNEIPFLCHGFSFNLICLVQTWSKSG